MVKLVLKVLVLAAVLYITYQAGYRNGVNQTPATVKTLTKSVTETVDEAVVDVKEVWADTTEAATDAAKKVTDD